MCVYIYIYMSPINKNRERNAIYRDVTLKDPIDGPTLLSIRGILHPSIKKGCERIVRNELRTL